MADGTHIEWTDATWQITTGCSVVSPGCTNCYAQQLAGTRLRHHPSRAGLTTDSKAGPVWNGKVRFNEQWLDQPLKWKRPRRIFVSAHGDLFHEAIPDEWIDRVFAVMALAPQHTFQVLTKRAERMREYMADVPIASAPGRIGRLLHALSAAHNGNALFKLWQAQDRLINWPLPNVWLGISVEDQTRADERIPLLLDTPAAKRFISAEPLLGPIDLNRIHQEFDGGLGHSWESCLNGKRFSPWGGEDGKGGDIGGCPKLDWVIVGGESGPHARPMHPAWAKSLRDQCQVASVAFHFKQWGGFVAADQNNCDHEHRFVEPDGTDSTAWPIDRHSEVTAHLVRVGKKAAGRLLDGVEHSEFPV